MNLVNYRVVDGPLPEPQGLYEYCLAANGVFVRAQREGLYACIPVAECGLGGMPGVRGLQRMAPEVRLDGGKVPAGLLLQMLERARTYGACENLFWLHREGPFWVATEPKQHRSAVACAPVNGYETAGAQALIDLHSHHAMPAFFSQTDNRDEQGFRIYAVLGRIYTTPSIVVRVGVYGHFYDLSVQDVFETGRNYDCVHD